MCWAVPAKVMELNEDTGTVELSGTRREVGFHLLEDVSVGDYVLVHAGFAIQKLDPAEAQETLRLLQEAMQGQREGEEDERQRDTDEIPG
ncbi:MAG: HypC/HybG/HupF family hydrogenase formation chaperone [Planctomycetota bacterium]